MCVFILVHGAYHGAWCWEKVSSRLKARGHLTVEVDLLSGSIHTLPHYIDKVKDAIMNARQPAIVVGHSFGGHVISGAAELIPDRISCLIYVSGVLLSSGKTAQDIPREQHELPNVPSQVTNQLMRSYSANTEEDKRRITDYFYGCCSREDAEYAINRLRPQPIAPLQTVIKLSNGRFGAVNKVYIECLEDKVIFPSVQRRMQRYWPMEDIYSIKTDHSPFVSTPYELSELICQISEKFN
jgi:pimeloyl-ACP methyl ester carboxylesterase